MKKVVFITLFAILFFGCSKEKKADKAGEKMQDFVISISNYARQQQANFIVIPQNGAELAFNFLSPEDELNTAYLSAIDGLGIEELFYNGNLAPDNERINLLQQIAPTKTILVSEYVTDDNLVTDAVSKNANEGFLCFPRTSKNYDYTLIPIAPTGENSNDIKKLSEAKNYLYLISTDEYSSKTDFINAIAATNYDVVLIDLFFEDTEYTPTEIQQLKTKANGGQRLVIAYMNVGAAESYRYYWQDDWKLKKPKWLCKPYEGFEDEIWVEFWNQDWQDIIYGNDNSYTKKIINAGFDGTYLDNVEGYYFLYFE